MCTRKRKLHPPWTIGISGIILAGVVNGSDEALAYALPLVLLMACAIGLLNGLGIVFLGIWPIAMTLAMLLAGTMPPYSIRAILYGLVMLGAVIALRERRAH